MRILLFVLLLLTSCAPQQLRDAEDTLSALETRTAELEAEIIETISERDAAISAVEAAREARSAIEIEAEQRLEHLRAAEARLDQAREELENAPSPEIAARLEAEVTRTAGLRAQLEAAERERARIEAIESELVRREEAATRQAIELEGLRDRARAATDRARSTVDKWREHARELTREKLEKGLSVADGIVDTAGSLFGSIPFVALIAGLWTTFRGRRRPG